jgi:hypothetical protein
VALEGEHSPAVQAMQADREFMKQVSREILSQPAEPLTARNLARSIYYQLAHYLPAGVSDSRLGRAPLAWKLVSREPTAIGTMRLRVRNQVLKSETTVELPWDSGWQARDDFFRTRSLRFREPPHIAQPSPEELARKLEDPDYRLHHEAVERSGRAYHAGARSAQSVVIDLLVHQLEPLARANVRLPQFLWRAGEQSRDAWRVMEGIGLPESIRPFLDGPYNTNRVWSQVREGVARRPILADHREAVDSITVFADELGGKIDSDLDSVLSAFTGFVHHQSLEASFSHILNQEHFAYAMSLIREEAGASQNLHYLDWAGMQRTMAERGLRERLPAQYRHAPKDIRKFVIQGYSREMALPPEKLRQLLRISRKMEPRTRFVFLTEEPHARIRREVVPHPTLDGERVEAVRYEDFEHFHIRGAMSIVESRWDEAAHAFEPLPMDEYAGFKFERNTRKPIAELGRFYVEPGLRPMGPREIWSVAHTVVTRLDVEKVVAETTAEYARQLCERFGFRKVGGRINPEGQATWFIEATPEEIFEVALKGRAGAPAAAMGTGH